MLQGIDFIFTLCYLSRSYEGEIGAALVLGGVDVTGPHLFTIHPHGSTDKLPYVSMGEFGEHYCSIAF